MVGTCVLRGRTSSRAPTGPVPTRGPTTIVVGQLTRRSDREGVVRKTLTLVEVEKSPN